MKYREHFIANYYQTYNKNRKSSRRAYIAKIFPANKEMEKHISSSIPGTITISTVGYGDIAPKTTGGKFVGAFLALLGLPLIAIPMPLIMSKFENYYENVKIRRKTILMREMLLNNVSNK